MIEAEIYVTLKKTVADPQGQTIKGALVSRGYGEVDEVRAGKLITLRLNSLDRGQAVARVEEMCRRLLANPVIEDYRVVIK